MKTCGIGLALFILASFVANAQIIKLKSSEGFVRTKDNIKLHYQLLGEGKDTLVIVHGGTTFGSAYLVPDLTPLAAHHTLLFFDQAGAGYSTTLQDADRYHINRAIEDIEAVRKHFRIQKLQLLAHSTGGIIAGFYAISHPANLQSMILMAPIPAAAYEMKDFNPDAKHDSTSAQILEQNQKKYYNQPADSTKACWDYYSLWARGYARTYADGRNMWGNICNCSQTNLLNPASAHLFQSMGNWNILPQLAQVKARALLIGGDRDPIPFSSFESWKSSLPQSTLLKFKGAGHTPHVDEPSAFFRAVEQFLQNKTPDETVFQTKSAGFVGPGDAKGSPYLRARAQIIGIENELCRLVNKAAWDSVAALYVPDGMILPPGAPPVNGRKAIATFWLTTSMRAMHSLALQLIDLEVSGDLLIARGKYKMSNRQQEMLDMGKFMAVYRKENNQWRLQTDMFNSSLETRSPLEIPDYLTLDKD